MSDPELPNVVRLANTANICFANSIIQSLFNIRKVWDEIDTLNSKDSFKQISDMYRTPWHKGAHGFDMLPYYKQFPVFQEVGRGENFYRKIRYKNRNKLEISYL